MFILEYLFKPIYIGNLFIQQAGIHTQKKIYIF